MSARRSTISSTRNTAIPAPRSTSRTSFSRTAGAFVSRRRSIIRSELLLAATLLFVTRGDAQEPLVEAEVKAAFVYNFLKFVEWPADSGRGPQDAFVVAIIGGGPTAEATERFLATKQVGERPLLVRRVKWDQSLAGLDAVFVAERDNKKRQRVFDSAAAATVLTIGEGEEFASTGGVIALLVENRKVRFDIDTGAAQSANLRVSSKLLALTRVVRSTPNRSGARR